MNKNFLLLGFFLVLFGSVKAQHYIQGSIQQGASPNQVNITFLPNYTSDNLSIPAEYVNYISISIVIPTASAAGVTPSITTTGPFTGMALTPAIPFSFIAGTETIYSWVYGSGPSTMAWTSGVSFTGASVTFTGGSGSTKVRLVDFTNYSPSGGANSNTYFLVVTNKSPFDVTNYSNMFYAISGANGSMIGTYGNGDQYVSTDLLINMSDVPACSPSSTLSVSNITTTSADISWSAVSGAIGYEYAVTTSSIPPASGTPITTTVYDTTGLTGNTQYYAHVRTDCGSGNFSSWVTTAFTTPAMPCSMPSTPTVTNITETTVDINWVAVSGAVGYEYAVTTSLTPPGSGAPITATVYNATGLTGSTQYYAYVRTDCGSGNFSSWVSTVFTTQAPVCAAPSAPTVTNITANSADINWNAVSGSLGYEYAVTTSATPPASGTTITATNYTPTGLTTGTIYYVHIRNHCTGGNFSSWSTTTFITLCTAPAAPVVSNITTTTANINWNAVSGVTGYQYAVTTSAIPPASGPPITGTTYNATGLATGTQYYAYIRSSCSAGNFSAWATVPFTTTCPATTTPTVSDITSTTATINWTAVTGAANYQWVVTTSAAPPASNTPTLYTTAPVTGLNTGTLYYVYIRTVCSPGVFSAWATTTFATGCPAPSFINVTNISSSADINWGGLAGSNGYEIVVSTDSVAPVAGSPLSSTNYQATGLNSFTTYYVFVRNNCSPGIYSTWIRKSFVTGCFKPNLFVIVNATTSSSVDIGWNKVNGAINYEYALLNTAAPPTGSLNFTNDTSLHFDNLRTGGKYYLHVRTHCSPNSISEWSSLEFHTSGIDAYPSPTTGLVTIILYGANGNNGKVNIYDATGKLVRTLILTNNTIVADMRSFAAGIYLIRYNDGTNKYTVKVLKQ